MSIWTCELKTILGLFCISDVEIVGLSSYPTTNTIATIVIQLGVNYFHTADVSEF